MKYETFLNLLKTYKKAEDTNREWYEFGIDLHEGKHPIAPYLYDLMAAGFETTYNKDGLEWIDWFIFDNEYGNKVFEGDGFGAWDKDGKPIAHSYESLWELLEKDYKLKS
tara:strand:- start:9829 stop:10158 length:330 start_codon:yes stop_codon:yes gene_type:complete